MKRFLVGAFAALLSICSLAATQYPLSLMSTTGSTSGQVPVSTGPSTPAAWGNVPATALTGSVPASNGGTGLTVNLGAGNMLVGTGTSAMTGINSVATGNVLASNGVGVAPSFQTPASLGLGCSASCTFTGLTNLTNTSAGASIIKFTGDGSTTPSKFMGVLAGTFTIYSSSGGSQLFGLSDTGNAQFLGSIKPSTTGGIVGTTTSDNAQAGSVGEFPTPTDLTNVSLTSNASANCSSVSLGAGDWEVGGYVQIAAAGTTLIINSFGGVSATSGSLGPLGSYWQIANNFSAGALVGLPVPTTRMSLPSTTTVYLVANAGFTTSTATASCRMHIRRER